MANDLIYCGNRIFVPESCRSEVFSTLPEGHQGIAKCRARPRDTVWWPSVAQEIATFITDCATCAKFRAQPAESLRPTEFPSLPWERLDCDIATHDATNYLIVVDYFSHFISVARLTSTTSSAVIRVLDKLFATHGILSTLVSDNVCWILRENYGLKSLEFYLDDFIGVGPAPSSNPQTSTAAIHKATLIEVFTNLGIPIATCEDRNVGRPLG